MEKERKRKVKNFTIGLIDFFLGLPEAFVNAFDRKEFYNYMNGYSTEKALTCSNIAQIISDLKRRKYIEVKKGINGESIVFTNKAKLAIVDRLIEKKKLSKRFCFVSFDIPESKRIGRDQFRRALKRMGFVKIQKSLLVNNKNIGDLVEIAAEEYGVSEYVVYMVTEATNIDSTIKKLLELNK